MRFKRPEKHLKDVNMKKLFRRNQIIITTLAIMIAAAGYLNYAGKKELEASADGGIYQAGALEISDEDIWAENQAASYDFTGGIEEAREARSGPLPGRRERSWRRSRAGMRERRPAWTIQGKRCSPAV